MIKIKSLTSKEKVHSWICMNEKIKGVTVVVEGGGEYYINLKSLLAELKNEGFI